MTVPIPITNGTPEVTPCPAPSEWAMKEADRLVVCASSGTGPTCVEVGGPLCASCEAARTFGLALDAARNLGRVDAAELCGKLAGEVDIRTDRAAFIAGGLIDAAEKIRSLK